MCLFNIQIPGPHSRARESEPPEEGLAIPYQRVSNWNSAATPLAFYTLLLPVLGLSCIATILLVLFCCLGFCFDQFSWGFIMWTSAVKPSVVTEGVLIWKLSWCVSNELSVCSHVWTGCYTRSKGTLNQLHSLPLYRAGSIRHKGLFEILA